MPIRRDKTDRAAYSDHNSMPIFGENDTYIFSPDANWIKASYSDLGRVYNTSVLAGAEKFDMRSFLPGSYKFTPDEVEVFYNERR